MDTVDIFNDPSSSARTEEDMKTEETIENEVPTTLVVDEVHVTPNYMLFDNAFDGKKFKYKMVIQNLGKRTAFVRLCEANSKTFEYKAFVEGYNLSPGLTIIRSVSYTCSTTMGIRKGFARLYINDKVIDYHFIVTLSCSILTLEPPQLDFGKMDAVNVAKTQTFKIKNSGCKATHFAIDLGRNPLDLIVEPTKGTIYAKSEVLINVELVGAKEGEFAEQFWIKTTPPLRVVVTGTFLEPKLVVRKFISSLDFTLVDFKHTYYGSRSTVPLLIKNFSPSDSMFCVMAEIKGTSMTLDEARKIDENYRNFIVKPIDGRMGALKGAVIQLTFAPATTRWRDKNYAACFLKLVRMDCRDVHNNEFEALVDVENNRDNKDVATNSSFNMNMTSSIGSTESYGDFRSETLLFEEAASFSFEHSVGVCLHGQKYKAEVVLVPNVFTLNDLNVNESYDRVLLVTNQSPLLPITVKYDKIASIDVKPAVFNLKPSGKMEVLVTVRPYKLGPCMKKISFELLSHDYPYDQQVARTVGKTHVKMFLETTGMPKKVTDPKCLCYDLLPVKLEPEYPFRLTSGQLKLKQKCHQECLDYIRNFIYKKAPEAPEEYELTNPKLLLHEDAVCQNAPATVKKVRPYTPFISLPPRLLYNIKIMPKSLRLKKVAPFTSITEFFDIENLTAVPIRVLLKASKSCITFHSNSRYVISSKQKKKIPFIFSTSNIGKYYVSIYVLVNDSTVFEVTVVAQVVPKTLRLETDQIDFEPSDGHYKFFTLINPMNAHTSFDWEVPYGCFKIHPSEGILREEGTLLSVITYHPDPTQPNVTEAVLTSESGQKRVLQIGYKKKRPDVVFDSYEVNVGVIALNIPTKRKIVMKNLTTCKVLYNIPNASPFPGVEIFPKEGVLDEKDSQTFVVSILLTAPVEFTTDIIFNLDQEYDVNITLKGVVDFPQFRMTPSMLYFRKIAPFSFDTLAFKVANESKCESYITFPFSDFPEFSITDDADSQYPHQEKIVLQPQQCKILFLHFHPNYVSTFSYYLPYVINDIIGPPYINDTDSTTPHFFFSENMKLCAEAEGVKAANNIPRSIPTIRVHCCAIEKFLEFSTLTVEMQYYGPDHYANVTSAEIEITNVSQETRSICIRTDDLGPPFSLVPKSDMNFEDRDIAYLVVIAPGEKVTLEALFLPQDCNEYIVQLPVFLKNYYNDKIFNILTLKGRHVLPTITPSINCINLESIPIKLTTEYQLDLYMHNHLIDCEVRTTISLDDLFAIFENGRYPNPGDSTLSVLFTFQGRRTQCINARVTFSCTCDASCEVLVTGVVENNLLTTHAFAHMMRLTNEGEELLSKTLSVRGNSGILSTTSIVRPTILERLTCKNSTTYPSFPDEDDASEYAAYMRSLQKTLEDWIYSQGFYLNNYYRIPDGFSHYCRVDDRKDKFKFGDSRKVAYEDLPLLTLIVNFAGAGVRQQLTASFPTTNDETEWMLYTYKVTANCLYFLRGFAVFIPHVHTKLLLNYEHYVLYEKHNDNNNPMEENCFYLVSKQCWIDLILQFIKAFVLLRNVKVNKEVIIDESETLSPMQSLASITPQAERNSVFNLGIYGEREKKLIKWISDCYEEERLSLWSGKEAPTAKYIVYFDLDLKDGLVLGAVTARYCPYVKHMIQRMITYPTNPVEVFHNNCVLIQTWRTLQLSYQISPFRLQDGNIVEMLLLVAYLYSVLPGYFPAETITIEAPLTQTSHGSLELINLGADPIHYSAVFFNNDQEFFNVAFQKITLKPGSRCTIKITYYAKCVTTARAALILSGETPGQKYGKTVTVQLVGVADVSYSCMQIPIKVKLYEPCEVTMNVQSPFKAETDYELLFGHKPLFQEQNELFPWDEVRKLKTIKEFTFTDDICHFDANGTCTTKLLLCCQKRGPRNVWFYFTNPSVGDWGIQVTITGKITPNCFEDIDVILPDNYETVKCRCKGKPNMTKQCPAIFDIKLPCMNNLLWNAMKSMLLYSVEGQELNFWKPRIYTPTGTRILTLVLNSETHPMKQVVVEKVKYDVVIDKKAAFVTLPSVVVEDITSDDTFNLPIHPVKDLLAARGSILQLESEDKDETRFYNLSFKSK